jgi:hypothetical protein
MQRMVMLTENTYQLLQIESKRRKKPISQTADSLIIAGMELDGETRAVSSEKPLRQLPKPKDLQAQIDAIITPLPAALEADTRAYNVFVEVTGTVVREGLTLDQATDYLARYNIEGDLVMGQMR